MRTEARFPGLDRGAGHYESFYIKATRPAGRARGLDPPHDPQAPGRRSHRLDLVRAVRRRGAGPEGDEGDVSRGRAERRQRHLRRGRRGASRARAGARARSVRRALEASWELEFSDSNEPFFHLPYGWMYGAPLPRTEVPQPLPRARATAAGSSVAGREIELDGWPGMVGHNWGAEHAERWVVDRGRGIRRARRRGLPRHRRGPDQGRALDHALGRERDARSSTARRIASAASTVSAAPRSTTRRRAAASR